MDVIVSENYIKFKALGGPIDMFFFAGPTPLDVIEQYTRIIGRPAIFDYRILGFHQSRYGYKNISQIRQVTEEYEKAKIPLDTIWFDIDYMQERKDFTIDEVNFPSDQLESFIKLLLKSHQRIVSILDPGIKIEKGYPPYENGIKKGIFIRNPNNEGYYVGQVWPGSVHFIDFTHKNSLEYWKNELKTFFKLFQNSSNVIGGIWLDMNEPANFIDGYNYSFYDLPADYLSFSSNFPRYTINNGGNETPIYRKTVPMDAITALGRSYQTHNLYGMFESIVSYKAMLELETNISSSKRPFLLTRSTFPGSGQWTATWLGDNLSTFPQMALSIAGVLRYGLAGLPLSGPDICGFIGNATEELCARWMALGSLYPFARNHNSIDATVDQEPFKSKLVAHVSRKYLNLRYSLLSFYYTLMHTAHVKGWPIWRPVFFYDNSSAAHDIDDQFFIGREFIVSPVLMKSITTLNVRLPAGEWYEWESLNYIKSSLNALKIVYDTPIDFLPIHLRAGSIITMQKPKLTTFETRQNSFILLIAFNSSGMASGDFYWDDGISLDVKDQFIDIKLISSFTQNQELSVSFSGTFGKIECPFVEKLKVLIAGRQLTEIDLFNNSNSEYKIIENKSGFDLIFNNPRKFKDLNMKILLYKRGKIKA